MSNSSFLQLVRAVGVNRPITAADRRSILTRVELGATIRHLSNEYGVSDNDIKDALIEAVHEEIDRREVAAYRAGRLSLLTPPPVAQRRAA